MEERAGYKAGEMKRALEGKVAVITGGNSCCGGSVCFYHGPPTSRVRQSRKRNRKECRGREK